MDIRTSRAGSETSSLPPQASLDGMTVVGFKNSQAGVEQGSLRHDDDIEARGDLVSTEDLSNQSFRAVSLHRAAQLLGRRNPEPAGAERVGQDEQRRVAAGEPDALVVNQPKFGTTTNPLVGPERGRCQCYSLLTVRRLRPFARRRLSTRRPFLVLIRTRNPWVFLRCRVFGWNVRFPFMTSLRADRDRRSAVTSGGRNPRIREPNRQC